MSQVRVKDWTGKEIHKKKRGFNTKKEALQWERDFISQADGSLGMKFKDFVEIYMKDAVPRTRETTYANKRYLFDKKVLPYFGEMPINAIKPTDIRNWQKRADSLPPSQRQMLFADLFANHQQSAHRSLQLCSEVLWTEREPLSQGRNYG